MSNKNEAFRKQGSNSPLRSGSASTLGLLTRQNSNGANSPSAVAHTPGLSTTTALPISSVTGTLSEQKRKFDPTPVRRLYLQPSTTDTSNLLSRRKRRELEQLDSAQAASYSSASPTSTETVGAGQKSPSPTHWASEDNTLASANRPFQSPTNSVPTNVPARMKALSNSKLGTLNKSYSKLSLNSPLLSAFENPDELSFESQMAQINNLHLGDRKGGTVSRPATAAPSKAATSATKTPGQQESVHARQHSRSMSSEIAFATSPLPHPQARSHDPDDYRRHSRVESGPNFARLQAEEEENGEEDPNNNNNNNSEAEEELKKPKVERNSFEVPLRLQYDPAQVKSHNCSSGAASLSTLKDYKMLAAACNRAGKTRMEGQAYYKIGTMYDELGKTTLAIAYFKKFLRICIKTKDPVGEALALNCVGVTYQELGGEENLRTAIEYHNKHLEVADAQGRVVANINLGLIYAKLNQIQEAINHQKQALQYALQIEDRQAESIALANLGLLGKTQGDYATAKASFSRHLELSQSLSDDVGQGDAYQQLGILASESGEKDVASDMLEKARGLFIRRGDQERANLIKSMLGVVVGEQKYEDMLRSIAQTAQQHQQPQQAQ